MVNKIEVLFGGHENIVFVLGSHFQGKNTFIMDGIITVMATLNN